MSEDFKNKVTVYSPESDIRSAGKLVKDFIADLGGSWELGLRLFKRNLKSQYRQSLLGITWAFIPTIITTLVWVFLNGQKIINIEDPGVPYPAFVMCSTLLWQVFAQSLQMPINAVKSGKAILVKINFKRESLLISGALQIGFDFMIKLVLIVMVFIVFSVKPSVGILLFPVGVLALALVGLGLGLLLLPFGMLYSDVQRFVGSFLPFWMLLTPVIYPEPRAGLGALLNKFNPVSPILIQTRDWLLSGENNFLSEFFWTLLVSILLTFCGLILFRITIPKIIERIGS